MNDRLLLADLRDENDSQRVKARLEWRQRMERAASSLIDEIEVQLENEESAPTGRALPWGGSSLSSADLIGFLLVALSAIVWVFAVIGFVSFGQFLQRVWGA